MFAARRCRCRAPAVLRFDAFDVARSCRCRSTIAGANSQLLERKMFFAAAEHDAAATLPRFRRRVADFATLIAAAPLPADFMIRQPPPARLLPAVICRRRTFAAA